MACEHLPAMWSHQHRHIVFHLLKHFTGINDEQKRTQHTSLWHARNYWDSLTISTITHDCLRLKRNYQQMDSTLPSTPIDFNLNRDHCDSLYRRQHQSRAEQYRTPATVYFILRQPSTITCCDRFDRNCVSIDKADSAMLTEQSLWGIP